jgi:aminomethyltransferase
MGYVETQFAKSDTRLMLVVRGNPLPALVATLPFIPHNYKRERRKAL